MFRRSTNVVCCNASTALSSCGTECQQFAVGPLSGHFVVEGNWLDIRTAPASAAAAAADATASREVDAVASAAVQR